MYVQNLSTMQPHSHRAGFSGKKENPCSFFFYLRLRIHLWKKLVLQNKEVMPSFLACIRDKIGIVWSMKSTSRRNRRQKNITLSTKTKQNHSQQKTVPSFSVKGLTRISMSQNKQCLSSIHTGMEVHLLIFFLKKQVIEIFCLFWIKQNYIMCQVCDNEMSLSKEILI